LTGSPAALIFNDIRPHRRTGQKYSP